MNNIRVSLGVFFVLLLMSRFQEAWAGPFIVKSVPTAQNMIALTFDDGPNPDTTEKLLKVLKKESVKATFFMLGKNLERHPGIAKKILKQGHELGNHSFSHHDYSKITPDEVLDDVYQNQQIFYKHLKQSPLYFRPPYGRIRRDVYPLLSRYFYKVIKWSLDPRDWDPASDADFVRNRIYTKIKPGYILLFHDGNQLIIDLLPEIIQTLRKKNYRFGTITELLMHAKVNTKTQINIME